MTRILIVDDEREVRDVLTRFFEGKNYTVLTADSGEAALDLMKEHKIDAVLLDIRMPGMGGAETLRHLRSKWPQVPVLMVSGEDDENKAKETIALGAFDYVLKPINLSYLERTLHMKLVEKLL